FLSADRDGGTHGILVRDSGDEGADRVVMTLLEGHRRQSVDRFDLLEDLHLRSRIGVPRAESLRCVGIEADDKASVLPRTSPIAARAQPLFFSYSPLCGALPQPHLHLHTF